MSSHEDKDIDDITGIDTTGHAWDGIKELNNPLPRWWLWCFYLTIIWGIGYTIAFPAWPLINSATSGMLGYSTRGEVAADIARFEEANAEINAQLASADLNTLSEMPDLQRFASSKGAAVFRNNCSQCHGSGAAGFVGYPNLLDDDWLWGGDFENIEYTIRHGIRNEEDWDARYSEMTAYDEIFTNEEVDASVQYVLQISGQEHDAELAAIGEGLFLDNCAACHGDNGMGNYDLGAPNLTDAIWLYGGDAEALEETVRYARFGVMPPWGERLTDAEVKAVTAYVHQLGGGE
ncbi:cytochrome-c oxidase, cbb3-type subunit III [Cognatiyoonia sp. IB215182]|uniref:cytochrome-c oxidase, cbb3-type subunit III n=1 Tax=Cognatiyoonia sp. IB215182 TaxID=3097353 RepID=UPI002A0ECC4B|nr:cytochrome-c oxidase, cbb3-type subunit III [Cognatiyoonia sp. IB215182]MDX8351545.1 cytochrome-c oxidase, cbb3-type subunit III [Cognatiyoonia sp. IB215182]